ncbi:hypothetical protein EYF80_040699 [Liparis tanakae]|uniref:Uncharacterized protein n=1 Tax=Liparis tanakae TaxID=230148 RepID=A0A4Z2G8G4_9TELE|nr:hypothetical protein EYF80_040699 [Liparis tanakae]
MWHADSAGEVQLTLRGGSRGALIHIHHLHRVGYRSCGPRRSGNALEQLPPSEAGPGPIGPSARQPPSIRGEIRCVPPTGAIASLNVGMGLQCNEQELQTHGEIFEPKEKHSQRPATTSCSESVATGIEDDGPVTPTRGSVLQKVHLSEHSI